jgi:hypothetical protein
MSLAGEDGVLRLQEMFLGHLAIHPVQSSTRGRRPKRPPSRMQVALACRRTYSRPSDPAGIGRGWSGE